MIMMMMMVVPMRTTKPVSYNNVPDVYWSVDFSGHQRNDAEARASFSYGAWVASNVWPSSVAFYGWKTYCLAIRPIDTVMTGHCRRRRPTEVDRPIDDGGRRSLMMVYRMRPILTMAANSDRLMDRSIVPGRWQLA